MVINFEINDKNEKEYNVLEKEHTESEIECYPSAKLLLDSCIFDYQRLLENYNRIYEKANIALAFIGILVSFMVSTWKCPKWDVGVKNMIVIDISRGLFKIVFLIGSLILVLWTIISLLNILKSRKIYVFDSIDIRNERIYEEKESYAAVWLIDKYTNVITKIRPIIQEKQNSYDKILIRISVGILLYILALVL